MSPFAFPKTVPPEVEELFLSCCSFNVADRVAVDSVSERLGALYNDGAIWPTSEQEEPLSCRSFDAADRVAIHLVAELQNALYNDEAIWPTSQEEEPMVLFDEACAADYLYQECTRV